MKKIMASTFLLLLFLIPAQITFGETAIIDNEAANIPIIKGRASFKPQEISIADFNYTLQGDISSASLGLKWGSKNRLSPLWSLSHLDLYLDNILLIDFGQYFKKLDRREKIALMKSLRKQGLINFHADIDQKDFAYLEDGKAELYLVGKPRFFRPLRLGDVTLKIKGETFSDDILGTQPNDAPSIQPGYGPGIQFVDGPGTQPSSPLGTQSVPEPSTMLLVGSGLLSLWGFRKTFRK